MENGTQEVLELVEGPVPITSIEVSPKSIDKKPTAIKLNLAITDLSKEFGDFDEASAQQWTFTEERPLVGIHGRMSDDLSIQQIGFITLDLECNRNFHTQDTKAEEEGDSTWQAKHRGFTLTGILLIIIGVVVFLLILVCVKH